MTDSLAWWVQGAAAVPDWYVAIVRQHGAGTLGDGAGRYAAQLLWQRGICDPEQLAGFLNPTQYQPSSPFAEGERKRQVERLVKARQQGEGVVIWGDFDAEGIAATAVLWDGLGQFFASDRLSYFVPNRLRESHGLSVAGIEALAGCSLIVTANAGGSALEIEAAQRRGIDVLVTDRANVTDCASYPSAQLSGVSLAYKLIEALYETLPEVPQRPLSDLLDLVAIGLISDFAPLQGENRYLAQLGIVQLQQTTRPGLVRLLELCQRSGDRPTDISFGLGPRINAISRIHGDARFCVELLTSRDPGRCKYLAEETELANARRKSLQKDIAQDVRARMVQIDLSTTQAIVLSDPQWSIGVLGLVAAQMAREYGRLVILLGAGHLPSEARGAACVPPQSLPLAQTLNLYALFQAQAHWLSSFGGQPMAMDLSLPWENVELFAIALNRQLREQQRGAIELRTDLTVTVSELGQNLFRELKLLEPYGVGNPVPRLLIQNCWFEKVWHRNIEDWRGRKVRYIKTEFELWDEGTKLGFPGVWWEHYRDEVLPGRCDAIAELDYNTAKKRYEVRLVALRPTQTLTPGIQLDWLLDYRGEKASQLRELEPPVLQMVECPSHWGDLQALFREAVQTQRNLAIAYPPPPLTPPRQTWQTLVGIAKYLSRTGKSVTWEQIKQKVELSDRTLRLGLRTLEAIGFEVSQEETAAETHELRIERSRVFSKKPTSEPPTDNETEATLAVAAEPIAQFLEALQEEQFHRRYFYEVPLTTLQVVAYQTVRGLIE